MDVPRRSDPRIRDPRTASAAAGRLALAAARRARIEQVRAAVRIQLAETHRRRQELSASRKPAPRPPQPAQTPATAPIAAAAPVAAGRPAVKGGR